MQSKRRSQRRPYIIVNILREILQTRVDDDFEAIQISPNTEWSQRLLGPLELRGKYHKTEMCVCKHLNGSEYIRWRWMKKWYRFKASAARDLDVCYFITSSAFLIALSVADNNAICEVTLWNYRTVAKVYWFNPNNRHSLHAFSLGMNYIYFTASASVVRMSVSSMVWWWVWKMMWLIR